GLLHRPGRQQGRGLHRRLLGRPRLLADHLDRGGDVPGHVLLRPPGQRALLHGALVTAENGEGSAPAFRRTDRTDAPYYLARYTERRGLKQSPPSSSPAEEDVPLYLRRFRERRAQSASAAPLDADGERV